MMLKKSGLYVHTTNKNRGTKLALVKARNNEPLGKLFPLMLQIETIPNDSQTSTAQQPRSCLVKFLCVKIHFSKEHPLNLWALPLFNSEMNGNCHLLLFIFLIDIMIPKLTSGT